MAEHRCKYCKLYNKEEKTCEITIIHQGEYLEITAQPDDWCHWEKAGKDLGTNFFEEVKELKF